MPKPSLYAPVRLTFTALLFAAGVAGSNQALSAQTEQQAVPCAACIVLVATPGQALLFDEPLGGVEILIATRDADESTVRSIVEGIRRAGGRPGLLVSGLENLPAETLGAVHRLVIQLVRDKHDPADLAFRLKTHAVDVRSRAPNLLIGISTDAGVLDSLVDRDIAPYLDFLATPERAGGPAFPASAARMRSLLALRPMDAASQTAPAAEQWAVELPADIVSAQQIVRDVVRTAPFLKAGLIAGGMAEISCGSTRAATYLDPETLATLAVVPPCPGGQIAITPQTEGVERVSTSTGEMVLRVPAAEGRFAEGVQVVSARRLTVREIIARHQAAAARQRRAVRQLISTGTMTLTFEAPGFPAPMAITTEAVIYTAPDRTEIEQRGIRVNGIAFQGSAVPRLPLLEPERVAAPPLAISLTDVYRYSLDGEGDADGVRCYVVSFDPVDRSRPLFSGRAWIAMDTFAMVKVSATQTGLRGPIVSSEQTDEFRKQGEVWLLARSDVRQIYEGAGHRTPIHRVLSVDRHEVNPPEFDARRQAAYASPSLMLRDTREGFRYLQRKPAADGASARVEPVVADRAERIRTVALGVIVDPNISRPLPFAGLSYVDFNLFGTGTQMNGFFGGTYGQLAIAVPSLNGTRWQLAGRAFGIASSYNDRAFVDGRENYEANISQRPAHASVWLLRPLTPRITARAGYDFDYTHYGPADSTAPSFAVPASQAAHAMRLGLEGQWAGWSVSGWWSGARRAGWREWGQAAAPESAPRVPGLNEYASGQRDYQRYGVTLTRSFVASPRLVGRVETAWMAGHDLDRFSRYYFGSFDNRLRGYPSALIRYDRGAVVRTSAAWAAGRLLRIDGFLDTAYVRDPGFGRSAKSYTGIGAAAEIPAPFGTLVAIEWGYGFQGLNSDGRRGTQVVRISGYKMF